MGWQVVACNREEDGSPVRREPDQGRVFHRRGDPIPTIRSLDLDGKHPTASVTDVLESRNSCSASVVTGDQPALITFSRPFFRGYQARIGGRQLAVNSYRELTPVVEVPATTSGRLVVRYRPAWLVIGVTLAILSGSIWLMSLLLAARSPAPGRDQRDARPRIGHLPLPALDLAISQAR